MSAANFMSAARNELATTNNTYVNARYSATGSEKVGKPFPLYKQPGFYFTDWTSAGLTESTLKKQFNLPTNNTFFRQSLTSDAINIQNDQLNAWTARTQTLGNNGDTLFCNNGADCSAWPGTTCNSNYENWPDAKGNQSGAVCSVTKYPELKMQDGSQAGPNGGGQYTRKAVNEGGIGKACTTTRDCGQGYECNNSTDFVGKNLQQTGYCAMTYDCPDGKHYLGTPYNSGIPQPPPHDQNNKGAGYASKTLCENNSSSQQDCVMGNNGKWFAVYPGYCPVATSLRQNGNPYGNVRTTSPTNMAKGIQIPAYGTNNSSSIGSTGSLKAFESWNVPSAVSDGSTEAMSYALGLNPTPKNLFS